MKSEKGITLIALVITIIVMLILVAVTVSVAINGGLIGKAEDAKNRTQAEIEKELLLSVIVGATDSNGQTNPAELKTYAEAQDFTVTGSGFPYTCTSSKGNIFYVYKDGTISDTLIEIDEDYNYLLTLVGKSGDDVVLPEDAEVEGMYGSGTSEENPPSVGDTLAMLINYKEKLYTIVLTFIEAPHDDLDGEVSSVEKGDIYGIKNQQQSENSGKDEEENQGGNE